MAKKKRKSVTVIMPADDYKRFEAYCSASGHKKSTLVVRLIRDHLDEEKFMLQKELGLEKTER